MTSKFIKTVLITSCAAITAVGAFAADDDKKTTEAPLTANSTGELQKKFNGQHVNTLPAPEAATKAVDNPDRVICKKVKKTGSRLNKRKVCATKKEWDMLKDDSVNSLRQMQLTRAGGDQ